MKIIKQNKSEKIMLIIPFVNNIIFNKFKLVDIYIKVLIV